MSPRHLLTLAALGVLGIAASAAIAVAANRITGEEIGLSAQPVSVIPADAGSPPRPAPGPKKEEGEESGVAELGDDGGIDNSGPGNAEDRGRGGGDDPGGGDNSGSGKSGSGSDDNSGKDSSGSGSGSSGSGSSGSSGSGSGGGSDGFEVEVGD